MLHMMSYFGMDHLGLIDVVGFGFVYLFLILDRVNKSSSRRIRGVDGELEQVRERRGGGRVLLLQLRFPIESIFLFVYISEIFGRAAQSLTNGNGLIGSQCPMCGQLCVCRSTGSTNRRKLKTVKASS